MLPLQFERFERWLKHIFCLLQILEYTYIIKVYKTLKYIYCFWFYMLYYVEEFLSQNVNWNVYMQRKLFNCWTWWCNSVHKIAVLTLSNIKVFGYLTDYIYLHMCINNYRSIPRNSLCPTVILYESVSLKTKPQLWNCCAKLIFCRVEVLNVVL